MLRTSWFSHLIDKCLKINGLLLPDPAVLHKESGKFTAKKYWYMLPIGTKQTLKVFINYFDQIQIW